MRIKAREINERKIRYLIKGFRCEGVVHVQNELGLLRVSGRTKVVDYNEVTGHFEIIPHDQNVRPVQAELELRSLCEYLRLICSFAAGTFLRSPVIKIYKPRYIDVQYFETSRTVAPEWPVVHCRCMTSFIEVAARSFGNVKIEKLPYAIEWILMPTTYNEIRILNRVIALECLVYWNFCHENKLDSDVAELANIVKREIGSGRMRRRLIKKLKRLEESRLADKIEGLIRQLTVPTADLPEYYNAIEEAVEVRNRVAHRGFFMVYEEDGVDQLWERLLVFNELVTRLFLAILRYEGRYECYIGGHHARSFPACVPVE